VCVCVQGAYRSPYMTDASITHVPDLQMRTREQKLLNFTTLAAAWREFNAVLQVCCGCSSTT
jgi:hypothetical protein